MGTLESRKRRMMAARAPWAARQAEVAEAARQLTAALQDYHVAVEVARDTWQEVEASTRRLADLTRE